MTRYEEIESYDEVPIKDMTRGDVLEAVARRYDTYASDQIACKRYGGKMHQRGCDERAKLYESVAEELREVRNWIDENE